MSDSDGHSDYHDFQLKRAVRAARIGLLYMTQEAFAEALGVSVRTVRYWEAPDDPRKPSLVHQGELQRLLRAQSQWKSYLKLFDEE